MTESRTHRVAEGECLASIAHDAGVPRQRIWDHADNAALREERDPYLLRCGDRLTIPEPELEEEDCSTEQRHRFRRPAPPTKLRLRLLENDEPRAGLDWRLLLDEDILAEGVTDDDGEFETPISPAVKACTLELGDPVDEDDDEAPPPERYHLQLGALDPASTIRGVQARLQNLGFSPGPIDDLIGPLTRAAIRQFQEAADLEVTGEPDDPTKDGLVEQHGC